MLICSGGQRLSHVNLGKMILKSFEYRRNNLRSTPLRNCECAEILFSSGLHGTLLPTCRRLLGSLLLFWEQSPS